MVAYIDGWGYQDNLLPEYQSKAGHDVVVIASANTFPSYLSESEKKHIINKGKDYYYNNIHIYRTNTFITTNNLHFWCSGIYRILAKEKPNIIFHHGINSSSLFIATLYKARHPKTKLFVDNHSDIINQSKNKIWNTIIHKIYLRSTTYWIKRYISKFYGVTPGRCDYLHKIYGIPKNQISLLPIGGDTDRIDSITTTKEKLREEYSLPTNSFVICSGGKMGKDKGTINLVNSFNLIKRKYPNTILVLFGNFSDYETQYIVNNTHDVYSMGWCNRSKILKLLKISDIAIWPIHHTTLIEDAIAAGTPIIVRKTPNTSHLITGNGIYVKEGTCEELCSAITTIIESLPKIKESASIYRKRLSYHTIVKQIESDYNTELENNYEK